MKKLCITLAVLALLCAAFIIPAAAYTDGEVIYSEDFSDPKYDYTDPNDNYDVVIANGKMELLSYNGDKLYQLPWPAVTGLDKFTVVYDWKLISSSNPNSAGHTLYFLFGVKDTKNAIYCGTSHVNGTEHLGTIIDGKWGAPVPQPLPVRRAAIQNVAHEHGHLPHQDRGGRRRDQGIRQRQSLC